MNSTAALVAALATAADRLSVVIESDNEDHGGASPDDVSAYDGALAALAEYQNRLVRDAELRFEEALSDLRELGFEPNIFRAPAEAGTYLDVAQRDLEMSEGFPLTTDLMGHIVGKFNHARVALGLPVAESPLADLD